jgi:y4mF family transcriptional regulator
MQKHIIKWFLLLLYAKPYKMNVIANFVKKRRKQAGLTQEEFAMKSGVALTVIRKIEQGKDNLNLSRVNQVLKMFGHVLGPINEKQLGDKP